MRAYYEIETENPSNHELNIRLPDEIPTGKIKVAIIYEIIEPYSKQDKMTALLDSLPEPDGEGLSKQKIQAIIRQERESWAD